MGLVSSSHFCNVLSWDALQWLVSCYWLVCNEVDGLKRRLEAMRPETKYKLIEVDHSDKDKGLALLTREGRRASRKVKHQKRDNPYESDGDGYDDPSEAGR